MCSIDIPFPWVAWEQNEPAVVSKLDLFGRIKGVLADLKVQVCDPFLD
jgi:hypothetical protein